MKMLSKIAGVVAIYVLNSLVSGNTFKDLCGDYTAYDWVNDLIEANDVLTVSDFSYTGACNASGIVTYDDDINYIGFSLVGIGTTALVLTTGNLNTTIRSFNAADSTSTDNYELGDSDLEALVTDTNSVKISTYDASVIEFNIVSSVDVGVSFTYIFASEEYNEFVGSGFNDVFAFWLNDVNVALINSTVVAINNVNENELSEYFVSNNFGDNNVSLLATEYDGLTVALATSIFQATANEVVHVKLAISDVGDAVYDSAVFIKPKSFQIVGTVDDDDDEDDADEHKKKKKNKNKKSKENSDNESSDSDNESSGSDDDSESSTD